jgi:hypothetical protein
MAVREALAFHERLSSASMPFVGFLVNKVHVSRPTPQVAQRAIEDALAAHPGVAKLELSATSRTMAAQALVTAHTEIETLAVADRRAIEQMRAAGGPGGLLVEVPLLRDDVHDIDRLIALERYLFGDAAAGSPAAPTVAWSAR